MAEIAVENGQISTGASTQGGKWCEMHHGEKWGGDFFVNNDAFATMYYYMNTFITLH